MADASAFAHKVAKGRTAFVRWRPQIVELTRGVDVYRDHAYPNPPIVALLLAPIAVLPLPVAAAVFQAIKLALAVACVVWALRLARGGGERITDLASAAVVLLALRPLLEDSQHGNLNVAVSAACLAGLAAFARGRDGPAGAWLGLAIVAKLTPALFIAYFAWKRAWRVVAVAVAAVAAGLLLPAFALGWKANLALLDSWFETMIRPYAFEGAVRATSQLNQSLPGILARLASDVPGLRVGGETLAVNIVSWTPDRLRAAIAATSLAVVTAVAWASRTPVRDPVDRTDWRLAAEYSLVFVAALLVSERSWKAHYVSMLLPYAVLVTRALAPDTPRPLRRALWATAAVAFVAMLSTSADLVGWMARWNGERAAHKYAEAYGAFALSAVVVFVALLALLRRAEPEV